MRQVVHSGFEACHPLRPLTQIQHAIDSSFNASSGVPTAPRTISVSCRAARASASNRSVSKIFSRWVARLCGERLCLLQAGAAVKPLCCRCRCRCSLAPHPDLSACPATAASRRSLAPCRASAEVGSCILLHEQRTAASPPSGHPAPLFGQPASSPAHSRLQASRSPQ